jgi:hypothetical protein
MKSDSYRDEEGNYEPGCRMSIWLPLRRTLVQLVPHLRDSYRYAAGRRHAD